MIIDHFESGKQAFLKHYGSFNKDSFKKFFGLNEEEYGNMIKEICARDLNLQSKEDVNLWKLRYYPLQAKAIVFMYDYICDNDFKPTRRDVVNVCAAEFKISRETAYKYFSKLLKIASESDSMQ